MVRGLDKDTLRQKWISLNKDWYSIYQWNPTSRVGYTEWIAEWIAESFAVICLSERWSPRTDLQDAGS
jgi:hypothetical protein